MIAEIIGPDLLIIVGVVALLFGGSRLPKLARSLGKARTEFHKGLAEGEASHGERSTKEGARNTTD